VQIIKNLKFANFIWDEKEKSFLIQDDEGGEVKLNKIYAFALTRFILRIAQKNFLRDSYLRSISLEDESNLEDDKGEEFEEDPRQQKFLFVENK
jgi:hypothetical protein